jgi:hypothetical protein
MNLSKNTNNDFSKKSRNKLNERFSKLRQIVERRFPEIHDWNRFRILDGAIAMLAEKPLSSNSGERQKVLNNKEACQYYRNKLKKCFETLKETLVLEGYINSGIPRQLNTRAGILEFTIESLIMKYGEPEMAEIRTLPTPIFRRSPKKRRSDHSDESTPPAKRVSSLSSTPTVSPASSTSSSLQLSPENQHLLQKLRLVYMLSNINNSALNSSDPIWRPW